VTTTSVHADTLEPLARSIHVSRPLPRHWELRTIGFLAMTYYRLGDHEKAQAALERLREVASRQAFADDAVTAAVLRETVALIGDGSR
jgi:hypothetical protein